MNGAILIYGKTELDRKNKANEILIEKFNTRNIDANPDILILEAELNKNSIGIGKIREGIKFLNQRPFANKHKALVIYNAELLTIEAQNALLKTLEEPPSYGIILLNVKTQMDVLPTILSRCKRLDLRITNDKVNKQDTEETVITLNELLKQPRGNRLGWAAEFAKEDKKDIITTLENWLTESRGMLLVQPNVELARGIELITSVKEDLEHTNVNVRLALEYLVIYL